MRPVNLQPDGTVVYDDKAVATDALMYLGYQAVLAEGYTLRSFFRLLATYAPIARINPFLPSFLEHYRICPSENCRFDGIDALELNRTVEMVGFPGDPRLDIFVTLSEVPTNDVLDLRTLWLENLLDLPLRLGNLKHIVFGDKVDTFAFETVFNLFEFIDSIAWQLSFHSMPRECSINP